MINKNENSNDWRERMQKIIQTCQEEIKKTTQMGKKMLYASKTSSDLQDCYIELGRLVAQHLKEGKLEWSNENVTALLEKIDNCECCLKDIEHEIHKIKFSSGPEIVDKESSTE